MATILPAGDSGTFLLLPGNRKEKRGEIKIRAKEYVKPIALKFKINPEIPILPVVNTMLTNFQSKRGQAEILLRGYLVFVEKFSSKFFGGNGLK